MIALWATVIAALIAAVLAPWVKDRLSRRNVDVAAKRAETATLASSVDKRLDELLERYTSDIADMRNQLRESNGRVSQLEREVAEWRAGIRGVVGVWVAVPASVMDYLRHNPPPGFPDTRFPGEQPEVEP